MPAEGRVRERRHKRLYYKNGDIVISAQSRAQKNVVRFFRVDKIVLARHSTVFEGMLDVSAEAGIDPDEQYDGVLW